MLYRTVRPLWMKLRKEGVLPSLGFSSLLLTPVLLLLLLLTPVLLLSLFLVLLPLPLLHQHHLPLAVVLLLLHRVVARKLIWRMSLGTLSIVRCTRLITVESALSVEADLARRLCYLPSEATRDLRREYPLLWDSNRVSVRFTIQQ